MLEFFGFGRNKAEVVDAGDTLPVARPAPGEYPTLTQREIVRMALHTLLKRHGIPAAWLHAEIVAHPTPDEPEGLLLQLTVVHWHAGFGLYAPALQHELLEGLKRVDPSNTASKYQILWKYAADCGCPHTSLPGASYWTALAPRPATATAAFNASAPARPPLPMQPMPAHRPKKFDLPSLPDDDDDGDNGFAATQMHDIR